jgi:hypothetical protein
VTTRLGLAARLFLVLLLVVVPAFVLIDPADSPTPGISDGSDNSASGDVTRGDHTPIGSATTSLLEARPVLTSALYRLSRREIPPDPARRPHSSRSPPQR